MAQWMMVTKENRAVFIQKSWEGFIKLLMQNLTKIKAPYAKYLVVTNERQLFFTRNANEKWKGIFLKFKKNSQKYYG